MRSLSFLAILMTVSNVSEARPQLSSGNEDPDVQDAATNDIDQVPRKIGCVFPFQFVNTNYNDLTARTCSNILNLPPTRITDQMECDCKFPFAMNYKGLCIPEENCNQWEAIGPSIGPGNSSDLFASSGLDARRQFRGDSELNDRAADEGNLGRRRLDFLPPRACGMDCPKGCALPSCDGIGSNNIQGPKQEQPRPLLIPSILPPILPQMSSPLRPQPMPQPLPISIANNQLWPKPQLLQTAIELSERPQLRPGVDLPQPPLKPIFQQGFQSSFRPPIIIQTNSRPTYFLAHAITPQQPFTPPKPLVLPQPQTAPQSPQPSTPLAPPPLPTPSSPYQPPSPLPIPQPPTPTQPLTPPQPPMPPQPYTPLQPLAPLPQPPQPISPTVIQPLISPQFHEPGLVMDKAIDELDEGDHKFGHDSDEGKSAEIDSASEEHESLRPKPRWSPELSPFPTSNSLSNRISDGRHPHNPLVLQTS